MLKGRKRRWLRLRYFLVPLFLVIVSMFFFPDIKGGAEIFQERIPRVSKRDLMRIDLTTIKQKNLTIDWGLQKFIAETSDKYK